MICWYCHWGWPEQVAAIYNAYEGLEYGFGHIVWADENFDTDCINGCLAEARALDNPWTEDERAAIAALERLLAVPEEIRCCEPDEYDGEHPENYPPPSTLRMVKVR